MLQGALHHADIDSGILSGHARQHGLLRSLTRHPRILLGSVRLHGGLRPVADHGARIPQGGLRHAGIGGGTPPGHARQYGSLRTVDGQLHLVPRPVRPHSGLWLNWRGSAPSMHPLLLSAPPLTYSVVLHARPMTGARVGTLRARTTRCRSRKQCILNCFCLSVRCVDGGSVHGCECTGGQTPWPLYYCTTWAVTARRRTR